MPPRKTRAAKTAEKKKAASNTSVTIEIDDEDTGDGGPNVSLEESVTNGDTSVVVEDTTDTIEIDNEPPSDTAAKTEEKTDTAEKGEEYKDTAVTADIDVKAEEKKDAVVKAEAVAKAGEKKDTVVKTETVVKAREKKYTVVKTGTVVKSGQKTDSSAKTDPVVKVAEKTDNIFDKMKAVDSAGEASGVKEEEHGNDTEEMKNEGKETELAETADVDEDNKTDSLDTSLEITETEGAENNDEVQEVKSADQIKADTDVKAEEKKDAVVKAEAVAKAGEKKDTVVKTETVVKAREKKDTVVKTETVVKAREKRQEETADVDEDIKTDSVDTSLEITETEEAEDNDEVQEVKSADQMEDEWTITMEEDKTSPVKEKAAKDAKVSPKEAKKSTPKGKMAAKAKDEPDKVESDEEDIEKITQMIEELRKKLPLPESFSKLRQLTVNIGPIKVDDLRSLDLHSILRLTSEFEIKFEKREVDDEKDKQSGRKESLGYVRIPFEIKTPNFFILVHNKLATLRIDGRDMSVKFPEQFNIALNDAKKYVEDGKKRFDKLQALLALSRAEGGTIGIEVEEKKRSLLIKNLPDNVEVDTLKALFPEAINVKLQKSEKSGDKVTGAILIFKSRELAKTCLRTNKDVNIDDRKIIMSMQVENHQLGRMDRMIGVLSKKDGSAPVRGARGGLRGRGSLRGTGFRGAAKGRGRPVTRASAAARVGQFGRLASNPIKERIARLRNRQELLRARQTEAMVARRQEMARAKEMMAMNTNRQMMNQQFGNPVNSMMADLIKMQAQALARSSMNQQSLDRGMQSLNVSQGMNMGQMGQSMHSMMGQGMQSPDRGRGMDTSPARGAQSQFSPGGQGRQKLSPGGAGGNRFAKPSPGAGRDNRDRSAGRGGGGAGNQAGRFERGAVRSSPKGGFGTETSKPDRRNSTGGRGGRGRGGGGRNRGRDFNRAKETPRAQPAQSPRSSQAAEREKPPSEDDPAAMMAYLKSTLARMEEKISQKGQSQTQSRGYSDEGYRDRGDKRKLDSDDYGRESAKRGSAYGHSDYDRKETYGGTAAQSRQSDFRSSTGQSGYSSQSGYGSLSGYGSQSGYGNQTGYGSSQSGFGRSETGCGRNESSFGRSESDFSRSDTSYGNQSGYSQTDPYGRRSEFDSRMRQEELRRHSTGGHTGGYGDQWGRRY